MKKLFLQLFKLNIPRKTWDEELNSCTSIEQFRWKLENMGYVEETKESLISRQSFHLKTGRKLKEVTKAMK